VTRPTCTSSCAGGRHSRACDFAALIEPPRRPEKEDEVALARALGVLVEVGSR
jgi:hypothetical protein